MYSLTFVTTSFNQDPLEVAREIASGYLLECIEKGQYFLTCTSASPDLETRSWVFDTPMQRALDD